MIPKSKIRSDTVSTASTDDSLTTESSIESSFDDSCTATSWSTKANSDGGEDDRRVDNNDFPSTAQRLNPRLTLTFNNRGKESQQRPRLLFRAFDPEHGLRARCFQDLPTSPPPPPTYGSSKFGTSAYRHLIQDKTFASPFLSFTQNPERALRAHLSQISERRSIAIVDYNVLEEEFRKAYGIGPGIWLVREIVKEYQMNDLEKVDVDRPRGAKKKRPYTGTGEFLIWGSVLCDPVATLGYEEALQVYESLNKLKTSKAVVGYTTGVAVGQCLKRVPQMYKAVVARKLIRAFEINGYEKALDNYYVEEFFRGVDSASVPDECDLETLESTELTRNTKRVRITVETPRKAPRFKNALSTSSLPNKDIQSQEQDHVAEVANSEVDIFREELRMYAALPTPTPPPDATKELHYHSNLRQNESAHPVKQQTEKVTAVNSTIDSHQTEKKDGNPLKTGQAPTPRGPPTAYQPEKAGYSSNVIDLTLEDVHESHLLESVARVKNTRRLDTDKLQRRQAVTKTRTTSTIRKVGGQQGSCHRINSSLQVPQFNESIGNDLTEDADIQIIAERKFHARRRYVRRTRTETKTVITIRSRSVSEGIIFNRQG